MSSDFVTCLKYGDICYPFYSHTSDTPLLKSKYVNNNKKYISDGDILDVSVTCTECKEKVKFKFNCRFQYLRCLNCNDIIPYYVRKNYGNTRYVISYHNSFESSIFDDYVKIVGVIENQYKVNISIHKDNKISFRCGYVKYTKKYKTIKSNQGRSKKGLQFSSYKYSIDYQWIDGEETPIVFKHKHTQRVYFESGLGYFDPPKRDRPKRSWKRTKKTTQWK